ncbi:MAG TPA: DUF1326 domain-containing protein [Tepidisphaeraceae bacterium]|nr:DUF1326 domain-containing protein [Tepidisphaeraceae bacterium]
MANTPATKWFIEADYIQACNCDYGCPCEFEAPPTMGFCQGMGAWRITKGKYGDVALDGCAFAGALKTPAAMHLGNGTLVIFIDERATPPQREALQMIGSGRAGGMPFEAFQMIFSKWMGPIFAPITFNFDAGNSSVNIGDAMNVQMEPIKNPVTGEAESIRIEHGTGFIFKSADCYSAKENRVNAPGMMEFSYPNKSGFVTKVRYGN